MSTYVRIASLFKAVFLNAVQVLFSVCFFCLSIITCSLMQFDASALVFGM